MVADRPHKDSAGKKWNEGARLSWISMRERSMSQADLNRTLAEHLGGSNKRIGYANRVLYGVRLPPYQVRLAIEAILGTPMGAWDQPALEPFSQELTQRAA